MYEGNTPRARAMRKILVYMLHELERNYHEVVLIPAPEPMHSGHKIRALQYANAAWYSKFAQENVSIRGRGRKVYKRPRTFIKRTDTIDTLNRMIAGNFRGRQAERLVKFIDLFRDNHRFAKQKARFVERAIAAGEYEDFPF